MDDDGVAELVGEGELRVEERPLLTKRLGSVVAVEPRLADGDRARMLEELAQLLDARRVRRRRLMGIDPERSEDACVRLRNRERAAARLDARADRDHARHADRFRALEQLAGVCVAPVEMRVGVDHAAGAGSSTRGKSGGAASSPWTASVRP